MEYINDININEAVIHILDKNASEPVLNEYSLELNEDIYNFIYKHIEKCFKDEDLKYAKFKDGCSSVKECVQDYLNGNDEDLIEISKKLARQLFIIINNDENVASGDLIVSSILTDKGPMIAILKLDYIKNFTHEIQYKENKIGIGIVPQSAGLPGSGQKIQQAAFIKPIRDNDRYDLMILDKSKPSKDEAYNLNYFVNTFLNAEIIMNERDMTKTFVKATEKWTRSNVSDNAEKAEEIRTAVKSKLREEDSIDIEKLSEELFSATPEVKQDFNNYIRSQGLEDKVDVDKTWVDKKLKRVRLNIDKQIDLYINEDVYHDKDRFEVVRNGDGSINLVVKNVVNYTEK